MEMHKNILAASLLSIGMLAFASGTQAAAIHDASLFTNILPANDDGSTGLVNLGFTANINGTNFNQTYVNNNGNITFNARLSTYTPAAIIGGVRQRDQPVRCPAGRVRRARVRH